MTDQLFDADISQLLESFKHIGQDMSTEYPCYQADSSINNQTSAPASRDIWGISRLNGDNMSDTHNCQACLTSIARPRGDTTTPVEESAVVVPVPGTHENVQKSTNISDKNTESTQAAAGIAEKTAELNSATRYIANLQDQLMKVQMGSYTDTGKLRKKISDMAWGRAGMRRQLVAIIREKTRASTDVACRHAELQNEIAVLKDALSTLRKVKWGVSVRERDRLVKAHTGVLEARNKDS
ncbi:hypothetical protein ASPSYDRAFT_92376 [Aspergillus sydowii CBS 593.65]|uniref:Uncharacterized protein n=1 Tax=Aspergillus sydowii CBS 593.65 TaxID=1036612 RepID=A0A1L9T9U5_9EURO|nr:uncharacterized protein ASPSYDRAFT_92376 [Aspergillus sydowii CBS 593.65]OJJ56186.1 hypothetical protein ASPSYDRAFT_92376 [Aspergillus sydowii CBS 593.65]